MGYNGVENDFDNEVSKVSRLSSQILQTRSPVEALVNNSIRIRLMLSVSMFIIHNQNANGIEILTIPIHIIITK